MPVIKDYLENQRKYTFYNIGIETQSWHKKSTWLLFQI